MLGPEFPTSSNESDFETRDLKICILFYFLLVLVFELKA
jgi:hypothetical protein